MPNFWDAFDGLTAGSYLLERRLAAAASSAWFLSGRRVVRLTRDGPEAPAQLARWERLAALAHPHLIAIYETGRLQLAGAGLIYAVMEFPEENLGEVLRERRLGEKEARPVLEAVTEALVALHAEGFVHGHVTPWNIVAVGDSIKLSSDDVTEAGELTAAHDVRSLGVTASEILTGSADAAVNTVPQAFRNFLRHAMEGREAARLLRELRGEPEPVRAPKPAAAPAAAATAASTPAPAPAPAPALPPLPPEAAAKRSFPKWGYGAVAAACALAGVLMLPRGTPKAPPPAPAPVAARVAPRVAASPPPAATPTAPAKMWRVIAFTYLTREAAEKKAHAINRRHPNLRAEVYVPQKGHYLVSVGGRMTREEALRLERRTRGRVLPRDTYARNFSD